MKIWAQLVIEVARKWWKKTHHCCTNLCAFKWNKRLQLKSFNISVRKYLFLKKVCYFRGSHFSQCFIPSTALHCSLPSGFMQIYILSNYQQCPLPLIVNSQFAVQFKVMYHSFGFVLTCGSFNRRYICFFLAKNSWWPDNSTQ